MANTYTLIASNTLSSSAASVTFSSIPATYTDLAIRFSARTDRSDAAVDVVDLGVNGVYSTNLSGTRLRGNGTDALTNNFTSASYYTVAHGNFGTSNTFGSSELYIPSYTVSQNKPMSGFGANEDNNTTATIQVAAGLWSNTAAITSLSLKPNAGSNFLSGSSFFLYGIKNS